MAKRLSPQKVAYKGSLNEQHYQKTPKDPKKVASKG